MLSFSLTLRSQFVPYERAPAATAHGFMHWPCDVTPDHLQPAAPRHRGKQVKMAHRGKQVRMAAAEPWECSEANILAALDEFRQSATSMFGCHDQASAVGITGDIRLADVDGPFVTLELSGRFWHRRETVLRNAAVFLQRRIPEVAEVDVADERQLLDFEVYDDTGEVVADWRSPDFNGDRATLEYQGIDPDSRGPFGAGTGGLRPGGSMLS